MSKPLPLPSLRAPDLVLSTFPSFANSFARIVVPGRKESRLNRITEPGGGPPHFPEDQDLTP